MSIAFFPCPRTHSNHHSFNPSSCSVSLIWNSFSLTLWPLIFLKVVEWLLSRLTLSLILPGISGSSLARLSLRGQKIPKLVLDPSCDYPLLADLVLICERVPSAGNFQHCSYKSLRKEANNPEGTLNWLCDNRNYSSLLTLLPSLIEWGCLLCFP